MKEIMPILVTLLGLMGCNHAWAAWVSPVGIPDPRGSSHFGGFDPIEGSHTMYTGQLFDYDNNGTPEAPYQDAGNGPYTHYIDNTAATATDASNPYGTPAKPRLSIPNNLPAGSVVEVHNGCSSNGYGETGISGTGTAAQPIFVRGISAPRLFNVDVGYYNNAGYIMMEGFNIFSGSVLGRQNGTAFDTNHIVIRDCEVHGDLDSGGIGVTTYTTNFVHHVLFLRMNIHDNGDVNTTEDQDVHGVTAGAGVSYLWLLDSEMARNSGDGIQINAGTANQDTCHHIFVGRCISHENKQTGFWSKQAVDVIFSENTSYQHRPSNSSYGAGMGFQYAPSRIWFINNIVYDCDYGFGVSSDSGMGNGTDSYFIGNLVYNIHHSNGVYNSGSAWSQAGFMFAGGVNRYVVNNTLHDVDAGINIPGGGWMYMANNIISNVAEPLGNHIWLEMPENLTGWTISRILFYQPDGDARVAIGLQHYGILDIPPDPKGTVNNLSSGDPRFVNPAGGIFALTSESPAVDTAIEDAVYAVFQNLYGLDIRRDRSQTTRPQGSAWDRGAYEFNTGTTPSTPAPPRGLRTR